MDNLDLKYRPNYDPASVQYMRDELTAIGFKELLDLNEVDNAILNQPDETVLLIINSVCGCAAGSARPGVAHGLQHHTIPSHLVTSFAGQDKKAVEYIRQRFLSDFMPSSPCIVLFQNGEILFIMERKDIVHKSPEEIGGILRQAFDKYCSRNGPSVSPEVYDQLEYTVQCSSNIPRYQNSS